MVFALFWAGGDGVLTAEAAVEDPAGPEQGEWGVPSGTDAAGTVVLHPSPKELPALVEKLRQAGYDGYLDTCGVDYLGAPARGDLPPGVAPERFEVVVTLMSHRHRRRLRLRVQVPEAQVRLESLVALFPGAENPERELFDMFGIGFEGHPDMTRILMPEDWQGHPLRKDYVTGAVPVRFKTTGDQR